MITSEVRSKINLHKRVSEDLRSRMVSGELRAGDRLPTYSNLIESYGVSANIISKSLRDLEADGIVVREQGRGVFVAHAAKPKRTATIGWMIPENLEADEFFWERISRGMRKAAAESSADIMYIHDTSRQSLAKVDGVIFMPNWLSDTQIDMLAGTPNVQIMDPRDDAYRVVVDEYQVGYLAAKHLVSLGHRKIAWMMHDHTIPQRRLSGSFMALREAGIGHDNAIVRQLVWVPDFIDRGRLAMREWLRDCSGKLDCTAIIVQNDLAAIGAIQALREYGIRVPDDVSIVGVDATRVAECSTPTLTSIAIPFEDIGADAVRLLMSMVTGQQQDPGCVRVWTPSLKIGGSTACVG